MKHTLQSLLLTTVLTLPTVFGSELDASEENPAATHHLAQQCLTLHNQPWVHFPGMC